MEHPQGEYTTLNTLNYRCTGESRFYGKQVAPFVRCCAGFMRANVFHSSSIIRLYPRAGISEHFAHMLLQVLRCSQPSTPQGCFLEVHTVCHCDISCIDFSGIMGCITLESVIGSWMCCLALITASNTMDYDDSIRIPQLDKTVPAAGEQNFFST